MSVPVCPVCCETLGCYGGPTTLPCGHNGCLTCMEAVQSRRSECPLCRSPIGNLALTVNRQLRDLVSVASRLEIDEQSRKEGWETFPSPRITSKHYASELRSTNETASPPSAPPLQGSDSMIADVLSFTPPVWVPDSASNECTACLLPFKLVGRLRHHCRLCGKIFCTECSSKRMLLPPTFNTRVPERVCDLCAGVLAPCQSQLVATMSVASQPPIHDVIDGTSVRSLVNNPLSNSLADDIYKASNILKMFKKMVGFLPAMVKLEDFQNAAGIAVISEAKLGFGFWSGRLGTGLVVSRGPTGVWSAPSAVVSSGAGWGLQAGGEITDLIIILPTRESVEAFTGDARVTFGGSVGVALGVGGARQAETIVKVGKGGKSARCFSYGISRGAFVGLSIEGAVIKTRDDINHNFYGLPIPSKELLSGTVVEPPPGASVLYKALNDLFDENVSMNALEDMPGDQHPGVVPLADSVVHEQPPSGHHQLRQSVHEDLGTSRISLRTTVVDDGVSESDLNESNGFQGLEDGRMPDVPQFRNGVGVGGVSLVPSIFVESHDRQTAEEADEAVPVMLWSS